MNVVCITKNKKKPSLRRASHSKGVSDSFQDYCGRDSYFTNVFNFSFAQPPPHSTPNPLIVIRFVGWVMNAAELALLSLLPM